MLLNSDKYTVPEKVEKQSIYIYIYIIVNRKRERERTVVKGQVFEL
jgi:hypothetical protein